MGAEAHLPFMKQLLLHDESAIGRQAMAVICNVNMFTKHAAILDRHLVSSHNACVLSHVDIVSKHQPWLESLLCILRNRAEPGMLINDRAVAYLNILSAVDASRTEDI